MQHHHHPNEHPNPPTNFLLAKQHIHGSTLSPRFHTTHSHRKQPSFLV
ncbi:hypothetical protein M3J09_004028 [Ascochyta lentis]